MLRRHLVSNVKSFRGASTSLFAFSGSSSSALRFNSSSSSSSPFGEKDRISPEEAARLEKLARARLAEAAKSSPSPRSREIGAPPLEGEAEADAASSTKQPSKEPAYDAAGSMSTRGNKSSASTSSSFSSRSRGGSGANQIPEGAPEVFKVERHRDTGGPQTTPYEKPPSASSSPAAESKSSEKKNQQQEKPCVVTRMVVVLFNHAKINELDHGGALDWACELGRFEMARLLLRRNKSLADRVLSWGVWQGSIKLVGIALEFKADVNQLLEDGRYPIHRAAEFQDCSILQNFLDAGADIEVKNEGGETPFEVAVRCNNVSCVRLLIDRKCRFSSKDSLLFAICCRSHDVLTELLRNEAFRKVAREEADALLFKAVAQDDLRSFRIIYPIAEFYVQSIHQLVRFEKYDMLSAALFEFEHPGLSTQDLTQLIAEAPNDDFKALLQRKIDAMNGVDLVSNVKKEAEEEEQLQSTCRTKKKTTKTTTKSKKK